MAAAELTACPARPAGNPAALSAHALPRELATAAAAVLALTGAAVLAGALDPALAGSGHPHPTLTGTVGEAESILLNNLRAIAIPFGLIVLGFPARRGGRIAGTIVVSAWLAVNCVAVGLAVGRWQGRLLPYLPHLPLEFSALTCSTCVWLIARDDTTRRREFVVLALATTLLLIGAACLETWATPHRHTRGAVSDSRVDTSFDQASPRRVAVVVCLRSDFAPALASRFKVAALPSPHQGSVPLGLLARRFRATSITTDPHRRDRMNSVNLIGRLTADPELRESGSGTSVGHLRLAVQRSRGKDGEDRGADFVDIVTFGRQAEVCGEYLAKGRRVGIVGRLNHREWEADDGSRRQKLEVIAENVEFLDGSRSDSGESNGSSTPEAVEAAA